MDNNTIIAGAAGLFLFGAAVLLLTMPAQPFVMTFIGSSMQDDEYVTSFSYNGTVNSATIVGFYPFETERLGNVSYYSFRSNGSERDISSFTRDGGMNLRVIVNPSRPPRAIGIPGVTYRWDLVPAARLQNLTNQTILVTEPVVFQNITSAEFEIVSNRPFRGYVVAGNQTISVGGS